MTSPSEISPDAQYIMDVAEELDLRLYYGYSGRGMLGRTCIGVNIDNFADIGKIMFHLGAINQDPDVQDMTVQVLDWRYDSMGKASWVMYWPDIPSPERPEDVCPPCPECKKDETEFAHMGPEVMGVETNYKLCLNCGHTWDPE